MDKYLKDRVFFNFQLDNARDVSRTIVSDLKIAKFHDRLKLKDDIDFGLEGLLYSLSMDFAADSLDIFSRWFGNPTSSDAILDIDQFNECIQEVFKTIPLVYNLRGTHSDMTIKVATDFLTNYITPKGSKSPDYVHPFTSDTWYYAFACLINSIDEIKKPRTDPDGKKKDRIIRYNLMRLFVEGFLITDLEYNKSNEFIISFFDQCYGNPTGDKDIKTNDEKCWIILFKKIFSQFISFPQNPKKRNFISNVIVQMKKCAKQYEDDITSGKAGNLIDWPIRAKYFTEALNIINKDIKTKNAKEILRESLPGDSFVRLLGDCIFIDHFWSVKILPHIGQMFKLFTWGEFSPESKWPTIFMKYLCLLMQKQAPDKLFNVVYGIMNASPNFVSEFPLLFNDIVDFLLTKAGLLEFQNIKENDKLLSKGAWVSLMTTLLEISRCEENSKLEKKIVNVIEKFANCRDLPQICSDFNVYRLNLLANAKNEDLFATLISQKPSTATNFRDNRVWDFEILSLAVAPLYMPKFSKKLIEKQSIEFILEIFNNKVSGFAKGHNMWFLIALFELSKSTDFFIKNRSIIPAIISYLSNQKDSKDTSPIVKDLIDIVYYSILIPTISVEEAQKFDAKYKSRLNFVYNGRILTFGENPTDSTDLSSTNNINTNNSNNSFGVIVRGPFGISSFDIDEVPLPFKQPADESTLKENVLHRDEITFPEKSSFSEIKVSVHNTDRSKSIGFLVSLGIAASCSNFLYSPVPLKSNVDKPMSDFDSCSTLVPLDVKIAHISPESIFSSKPVADTPRFKKFMSDLGSSFKMGTCMFNFLRMSSSQNGKGNEELTIVFNESGQRINTKMFAEDYDHKLIVSVSPVYKSLTVNTLMYRVTIIKSCFQCLILPIPLNKSVVVSKKSLARLISTISFFYFAQGKDEFGAAGKKGTKEEEPPHIVAKYVEVFKKRKELLEILLSSKADQTILESIMTMTA